MEEFIHEPEPGSLEEECRKMHPDPSKLRELCSEGVPEEWRGIVWQVWLGVYRKRANLDIVTSELPAEELHVIRCDATRTRQRIPFFQDPAASFPSLISKLSAYSNLS
jgi:hypothetical protein